MASAADGQREAWRLAFRLSMTAAGGVLFVLVGALLADWISFGLGALCAAAADALLRRHDHRSANLR